mmetsp:Transcript_14990/g.42351  ORF Transcript_14990/g.42351 Transcript_14990/m.42351 type:complete len:278 (-) Transcript_14990:848-1681(-)
MRCAKRTPLRQRRYHGSTLAPAQNVQDGMVLVLPADGARQRMVGSDATISRADLAGVLDPFSVGLRIDGGRQREHGSPPRAATSEYLVHRRRQSVGDPAAVEREVDELLMVLLPLGSVCGRARYSDRIVKVDGRDAIVRSALVAAAVCLMGHEGGPPGLGGAQGVPKESLAVRIQDEATDLLVGGNEASEGADVEEAEHAHLHVVVEMVEKGGRGHGEHGWLGDREGRLLRHLPGKRRDEGGGIDLGRLLHRRRCRRELCLEGASAAFGAAALGRWR